MRIQVELTGRTPLLMHNERLSDPTNEWAIAIKEITDKKTNQTEKDRDQVSKLEWYGGIYADQNKEVVIPAANLIKCFREAASVTKSSMKIARGLSPTKLHVPLINGGKSRNIDELWKDPVHADRRQVKVGRSRVKRTRPKFPVWSLIAEFELVEDVLDLSTVTSIIELAGVATGLGDARILGHGRFDAQVRKI